MTTTTTTSLLLLLTLQQHCNNDNDHYYYYQSTTTDTATTTTTKTTTTCTFGFLFNQLRAGSRVVRMDRFPFLADVIKDDETRLCLSCLLAWVFVEYIVVHFRDSFVLTLVCVCMCAVSWVCWFSCQYLPSDWL